MVLRNRKSRAFIVPGHRADIGFGCEEQGPRGQCARGAEWPMRLPNFIAANQQSILVDWVAFARLQVPAAHDMDEIALLDHGKAILEKIVSDMRRPEDEHE